MASIKNIEKNNCKSERYLSGLFGEKLALEEMKKYGFSLVKQRYKTSFGEIDLIVENKKQKLLVFIEVKRRKKLLLLKLFDLLIIFICSVKKLFIFYLHL